MAGLRPYRRHRAFVPRSLSRRKWGLHLTFQRRVCRSYSRYKRRRTYSKWRRHTSRSYNKSGFRRRVKPMKMISRTMQDKDIGVHQWERFMVQGIPEECRPMSSFVSYYMLNILPRGAPMSRDALMPFIRTTDMVRVRGIGYSLNFVLMPKSGFRL